MGSKASLQEAVRPSPQPHKIPAGSETLCMLCLLPHSSTPVSSLYFPLPLAYTYTYISMHVQATGQRGHIAQSLHFISEISFH